MKQQQSILVIFALITLFIQSSASFAQEKSANVKKATIAVMSYSDFVPDRTGAQSGQLIGLPDALASRIIENLTNSNRFNVVERNALRRVVLEQRFGQKLQKNYLDKTLDKAIDSMEKLYGGEINATAGWGNYNDIVKDFQDLGSMVNADFLVLGNLEKVQRTTKTTAVPYSTSGKVMRKNVVEARLRLRVIEIKTGQIAGATSIRTKLSETLFAGKESESDQFSLYDDLGKLAGVKILDMTFPAKIVSLDPLIISRGNNDGVKLGDIYRIKREGKEVKDSSGLVLARLKTDVGSVEVTNSQNTIAIVKATSGSSFEQGDLAILDLQSMQQSTAVVSSSPVNINPKAAKNQKQSTGGKAKIPRLAVGLVKMGSTARTSDIARLHTPIFTDTMISRLTQTKRFQLIDRQEVDQLINEQLAQALTENRDIPSAMGTLKGADYLVYGNLASISEKESITKLPNSNRIYTRRLGQASGNMRIVDARSGDVIESKKIAVEQLVELAAAESELIDQLADAYAEQVVLMLMNALYPIKAAHVSNNGLVYINRGDDGGLFVGEELDIFKPGQAIIDPDTGVQLGVEEEFIGKLVVQEVEAARSKGEQIQGMGINRGDLLKRTTQNKNKSSSQAAFEQKTSPRYTGSTIGSAASRQKKTTTAKAKPVLAMGTLKLNRSARTSGGFNQNHIKRIADEMISNFSNSKRFMVMERQEVDQILDEKTLEAITAGGDIKARLGELAGADYLIHGEVVNFYANSQNKKVAYLDEIQTTTTVYAEGMFRIVDVHNGAIVSSEKVRVKKKIRGRQDSGQIMSDLINQFATRSVNQIILKLYPIKVMGSSADGMVYLNRGAGAGIKMGQQYKVMRPGQDLIDPDTGQSFGAAESKVAVVEIMAVEDSRSQAQILSGGEPQSGDILRKAQKVKKKKTQRVMQPNW